MSISFPAPCNSHAVQALLAAAESDGVDATLLHEILWLTTAHAGLRAFHLACTRLTDVIHSIPPSWDDLRHEAGVDPWLPVLNWVTGNGNRLAEAVGRDFLRVSNSTGHNPIRGSGVDEFPFYAVLCEPIPAIHPPRPYWLLTGHLLLGYVTALREESEPDAYHRDGPEHSWKLLPNGVESAARAVRRLFEGPNYDLLSKLELALPTEQFADALEHGATVEDANLERDRHNLYRYLQKCLGCRHWRDSDTQGGGGSGGHEWVGGRVSVFQSRIIEDSDPSGNWGSLRIARFRSVSSRKANAHLRSDLSLDEDESDEEIALGDSPCGDTIANPGALARTTRAKSRALVRSNQLLGWSYEYLTIDEIQTLTKLLSKKQDTLLQKRESTESTWREETQVVLAIKTMLATGSDIDRVSRMLVASASTTLPDGVIAVGLVDDQRQSRAMWIIPALRPPYKTDQPGSVDQLHPEASHVEYADPLDAAPLISMLMECNDGQPADGRLLSLEPDALAEKVAALLKKLDDNGGRISTTKVINTLWHAAYKVTGDAALASCITGTPHPLARVRLHYTTIPKSTARNAYARVFGTLLGKPCPSTQHGLSNDDNRETYIGARLCPTPAAVRSLFVKLRGDVEATRTALNRTEFVTHHNLLTLYATLHFAYATTCRAVVTPYLAPAEIDINRQLATLSDKDDESRHKTRLVWIPRVLLDTMLAYEAHLDSLKAQLSGLSRSNVEAPCFFLDDNMKPLPVRPKTIEPLLQRYLNVRANTHRRFLRSELLLRGCNPEVVDAFMGHWHAGEEPFSPYSTFSFSSYTQELRTYLEPLLAEIGLDRPIAGRLA